MGVGGPPPSHTQVSLPCVRMRSAHDSYVSTEPRLRFINMPLSDISQGQRIRVGLQPWNDV